MWIEVVGGPQPLWVQADKCRLSNGDLAFVNEAAQPPPLPGWFGSPVESRLREAWDMRASGFPLMETRSIHGQASQIVAFYRDCIEKGGLIQSQELQVGRAEPGFSAQDAAHKFGVDIYEHKDLAFWTIQLSSKVHNRKTAFTSRLLLVVQNNERLTLRHLQTAEEYWAPIDAVRDSEPPDARPETPRTEPIRWSLLPVWIQFNLDTNSQGEVHRSHGENDTATILKPLAGDPRSAFDDCLEYLDTHGFDGSGTQRPDRSYYVSVLQWGHSRNVHIQSEAGDRATATVVNTLGHTSLFIRYSTPQHTLQPDR